MNAPIVDAAPIAPRDHLPLAYAIARGFYIPGFTRADVEQEAAVGLLLAAQGYAPDRGAWGPWASWFVHKHLCAVYRANHRVGRFGSPKVHHTLRRERTRFMAAHHRDPSPAELHARVAGQINVNESEVARALAVMMGAEYPLDAPTRRPGDGGAGVPLVEQLHDGLDPEGEAEARSEQAHDARRVRDAIARLPVALRRNPIARDVCALHLLAEEPETLANIGRRHGRTRERVRQLAAKIERALRPSLAAGQAQP